MSVNTSSSSKYSNSINSNYDVNTPTGEHFAIKNQKKFNVSDDLSTSAARKDKINNKKSGNDVETMDLSGDNAGIVHIKKGDTGKISSSALDLSKITDNHYDAANGKFIDEKYILKDYWTGDFDYTIEDDGVVCLSKNGVSMGRTTIDAIKNFLKSTSSDIHFYGGAGGASMAALNIDSSKYSTFNFTDRSSGSSGLLAIDNNSLKYIDNFNKQNLEGKELLKNDYGKYRCEFKDGIEYRIYNSFDGKNGTWSSVVLTDGTELVYLGTELNAVIKDGKRYDNFTSSDIHFYGGTGGASMAALNIDSSKYNTFNVTDSSSGSSGLLTIDNNSLKYIDNLVDKNLKKSKFKNDNGEYRCEFKDGVEYRVYDSFDGKSGAWRSVVLTDGTELVYFGSELSVIIKDGKRYDVNFSDGIVSSSNSTSSSASYSENVKSSSGQKTYTEADKIEIITQFEKKASEYYNWVYRNVKSTELGKIHYVGENDNYYISVYYPRESDYVQKDIQTIILLKSKNGGRDKQICASFNGEDGSIIYRPYTFDISNADKNIDFSFTVNPDMWNI